MVAAVLSTVLAAAPAVPAAGVPAPPQRAAAALAPVVIVLDASGSMNTADAPGPRIAAAKRAVLALVRELPARARVGVLTYGTHTGSGAAERAAGCRDVSTLAGLGHLDKTAVSRAVRAVRARGYTPIGTALRRAAATLRAAGVRGAGSIVLVSDGQDTCAPPDPCTVARQLHSGDTDLVVHTVGFRVGARARRQLQCIAGATGGTYRDASSGDGLGPVLQSQVDAGLRPYGVTGTPVDGTPTPAGAPALAAGQYTDTFPRGGAATKYYTLRLRAPETLHVAATAVPPALRGGGTEGRLEVSAELRDRAGDRCLSSAREHDSVLAGKVDPVTVVLSGAVGGPDWSKRCPRTGTFVLALTREDPATVVTRSELVVWLEPAVRAAPAAVSTVPPGLSAPRPGRARRSCTGGASFDTAPLLSEGTCRDSLATGETRYYRVHLATGQRFAYTIVVDRVAGAGHGVGEVRSAVATPLREDVTLASTSNAARDFGGPVATALTGATLVPVDYGNRGSGRSDIRPYSLAGDYYLSLGMSYPVDALPYRTGVTVTVQVAGRPRPGPDYLRTPRGQHVPESSAPTAPTSKAPRSPAPAASRAAEDQAASGSSSGPWLAAAAGLVVLVAVVGLLARRRASERHR